MSSCPSSGCRRPQSWPGQPYRDLAGRDGNLVRRDHAQQRSTANRLACSLRSEIADPKSRNSSGSPPSDARRNVSCAFSTSPSTIRRWTAGSAASIDSIRTRSPGRRSASVTEVHLNANDSRYCMTVPRAGLVRNYHRRGSRARRPAAVWVRRRRKDGAGSRLPRGPVRSIRYPRARRAAPRAVQDNPLPAAAVSRTR
jgi:hypothetical protein